MLTGVKVLVDNDRLNKLEHKISRLLENEVKAQCDGKFSESYAYQNTTISAQVKDIIEQIKYQIIWQRQAIDRGNL